MQGANLFIPRGYLASGSDYHDCRVASNSSVRPNGNVFAKRSYRHSIGCLLRIPDSCARALASKRLWCIVGARRSVPHVLLAYEGLDIFQTLV